MIDIPWPAIAGLRRRSDGRVDGRLGFVAIVGPLIISSDPNAIDLSNVYASPSASHLLGTDSLGRDLLGRLVYGSTSALIGPLLVVVLSTVAGTGVALCAAWFGGKVDAVLGRFIDAMFAFPGLLVAILSVSLFGPGLLAAGIALSIAYTPYVARIVRASALRERSLPYVAALNVLGFRRLSIVVRHLLPNLRGVIIAAATLSFGYALIDLAALSFIGLGVQAPAANWGVMIAAGVPGILQGSPEESLYASLAIVLTVGAVNYLGDRLISRAEARS
jgi:peptide/nickel transport system permease protein